MLKLYLVSSVLYSVLLRNYSRMQRLLILGQGLKVNWKLEIIFDLTHHTFSLIIRSSDLFMD